MPWPPRCRHEPPDEPATTDGSQPIWSSTKSSPRSPPDNKTSPGWCSRAGPFLRVCYRHDWRFSEDLDFDWIHTDDSKQAIHDFFDRVLKAASRAYGTAFDTKWGANKLNIYWEQPGAVTGVIYTDVKPRHHLGAQPTTVPWAILDRYPQIDTANPILGYSPASMLAAKLDCIANPNRLAPRDYYDLHRLLQDPSIDTGAALDEFTARHTATHPPINWAANGSTSCSTTHTNIRPN